MVTRRKPIPITVRKQIEERSNGVCEARVPMFCTGRAEHLHHRKLRSQGGENTPENLCHICHLCHDWAHRNPKEANARGLIVLSWQNPEDIPL